MRRKSLIAAVAIAGALLLAVGAMAGTTNPGSGGNVPTGKGFSVYSPNAPAGGPILARGGIQYHGGPVMTGTNHIYYIWYGNWSGNSATTILDALASTLGGSSYWNIETTYYQIVGGVKTFVSNSLTRNGDVFDSYSQGSNLSDAGVLAAVSHGISSLGLPLDTSGIYLVLTSSDVNETSGFCTQYCGWHDHATISGQDIKYGFIGNPDRCPSACEFIVGNAPNGNAGADGMASVISHELDEAVSDPDLNAWYFSSGNENADQCAWTFGTTFTCNGATANINLGSRCFLIQRNWKNTTSGAGCTMHYP
jgi:hypothetical protein